MGWWYPLIGKAERSFISESNTMYETFRLTTVQCMFGENVIVSFKQINQLLSAHLTSMALININTSEPNLLQLLF